MKEEDKKKKKIGEEVKTKKKKPNTGKHAVLMITIERQTSQHDKWTQYTRGEE